jgi:hypothetical protein
VVRLFFNLRHTGGRAPGSWSSPRRGCSRSRSRSTRTTSGGRRRDGGPAVAFATVRSIVEQRVRHLPLGAARAAGLRSTHAAVCASSRPRCATVVVDGSDAAGNQTR